MKNGKEKQDEILKILNQYCRDKKTVSELYEMILPKFKKKFKKEFTFSTFRKTIEIFIRDEKVEFEKAYVLRSGSKRPIYLINKKQNQNEHS